ncbi:MAG: HAD-IC family P-type ATPase [Candidatus Gastranaerophilales bacterium]|nr:HAD-IC family P-type ATPase [Candidatus Gastranaerophilales bacterium]
MNTPVYWHKMEINELFLQLKSDIEGLSEVKAADLLNIYGKNSLPTRKPHGILQIFFYQFLNPLIYILLVAGVLAFIIGDKKDSFFIFVVILINSTIGAIQEWKAEKSSETLQKLIRIIARVKRDGEEKQISSENLVPGDIVILESGNKVPADIRLLSTNNLNVDESLLTGESVPVKKCHDCILEENLETSEKTNMVFAGSVVTSGRATGIVVSTGLNTEIGKIAQAINIQKTSKSPLIERMEKFAKHISYIVLIVCFIIAVIEILRGQNFTEVFFLITALAVSAIPEGLPAAITVALSVGMSRMTKKNVLIRKLTAVESLGSCTCIASDKTGTLTINKQTVKLISLPDNINFQVTGEGYTPEGKIMSPDNKEINKKENVNLDELIKISVIANEASLQKTDTGWISNGDAVDVAILSMGYKYGFNYSEIFDKIKTITEIPYESEIAYSARFYKDNDTNNVKIAFKGAFEVTAKYCNKMLKNGNIEKFEADELKNQAIKLAEQGYRLISVATGEVEEKNLYTHHDIHSLIFLGFICLIDPLRDESASAIEKCREAGVKVVMITGDHPATALAIGKELKIADSSENVITGAQWSSIADIEHVNTVLSKTIFARVAPMQKLEIVDALIKSGNYVAVTGDGVNDAPALKKAHIGVAMGSGTDIAKDVSSMVITNDNFSSIVSGIEEGRYTYDNIRKVIYLLISTGVAEIFLFLFSLIIGLPIPLIAVQLLWLNLVTNGIQGVALAFEKGEPISMRRPPRNPKEGIFNKLMVNEVVLSGFTISLITFICWVFLLNQGWNEFQARNIILLLMVLFENIHVFNCRSEYVSAFKIPFKNNIFLVTGVFIAQAIHIISMQIPLMQKVLKTEPVEPVTWFILLFTSALLLMIMEIFKRKTNKQLPYQ